MVWGAVRALSIPQLSLVTADTMIATSYNNQPVFCLPISQKAKRTNEKRDDNSESGYMFTITNLKAKLSPVVMRVLC